MNETIIVQICKAIQNLPSEIARDLVFKFSMLLQADCDGTTGNIFQETNKKQIK